LNNFYTEEFYSLEFFVSKDVLTPRNETEILVNEVLKYAKNIDISAYTYIDVGTGSGCIPIAILKNISTHFQSVFGVDISEKALEVARKNRDLHELSNILNIQKSFLLEIFFSQNFKTKNLLITANLPYIKNGDFANMDTEVLKNDPHLALFGWENTGFELYEELFTQMERLKNFKKLKKIIIFIEIGFDQYEYSRRFFEEHWYEFEHVKDYSGNWRVVRVEI